ncbi:MAG: phenylalanine--tRNA ligase subunit alpha [Promethearchaeota archaeon]
MSELEKLVEGLHHLERKVLNQFRIDSVTQFSVDNLVKATNLDLGAILRVSSWLRSKKIIEEDRTVTDGYSLTVLGSQALQKGLPERRILQKINHSQISLKELMQIEGITKREISAGLGILKRNNCIEIQKGVASLTDTGREFLKEHLSSEAALNLLGKGILTDVTILKENKEVIDELLSRGLVKKTEVKSISVVLSKKGQKLLPQLSELAPLVEITPETILNREWETHPIRPYNILDSVPKIYPGKRHFLRQAMDYIRRLWLDMGFTEMRGPIVESNFWCFDALFVPQDHPARDMQDTFFIKDVKAKLPDKKLINAVKVMHESGGKIGSTGWQYEFSFEEASRCNLRPHTTCLSARTLAKLRTEGWPAKYFSVGRCFRNETLTWKNLVEFGQVEGIVVGDDVTFQDLLGYLKTFFTKLGYPKARYRPGYFPYTEPSVEIEVWVEEKQAWMELGGSGVFRPELTEPLLGEPIPVLAWGPGLGRQVMEYYNIQDIRMLYANDITHLREARLFSL